MGKDEAPNIPKTFGFYTFSTVVIKGKLDGWLGGPVECAISFDGDCTSRPITAIDISALSPSAQARVRRLRAQGHKVYVRPYGNGWRVSVLDFYGLRNNWLVVGK